MTTYRIREAAEWGMRWARPAVRQVMPVSVQYVHHSAGNPFHTLDADAAFRRMNEMAIGEGMSAIDYTVLVHEHPASDTVTLGIARGEFLPAATYHANEVSKAVCAMGYFHPGHRLTAQPSTRMIHGIALALALCVERGWNIPTSTVRAHRQNPYSVGSHATACPGDLMMPHMPRIVELRNAHLSPNPPAPPAPTPTPTPNPGDTDVLDYRSEIAAIWSAPPSAYVTAGKPLPDGNDPDRWLAVVIAKVGGIAEVQADANLKVTGLYDAATERAYNVRLAAMRAAAGK